MRKTVRKRPAPRLCLDAETAADLMTPTPASVPADMRVEDAMVFLMDHRLSAAAVIDDAGRPVGVLSESDLVARVGYPIARPSTDLNMRVEGGRLVPDKVDIQQMRVREIMTPDVLAVAPEAPVDRVVKEMQDRNVHQLFVIGGDGALAGVIGFGDVLRHLRYVRPRTAHPSPTGKRKDA